MFTPYLNEESSDKNQIPSQVPTESLIHLVEVAKAEAESAAERTAIAEAESISVPEAAHIEVEVKTVLAKEASDKAIIMESFTHTVIQVETDSSKTQ